MKEEIKVKAELYYMFHKVVYNLRGDLKELVREHGFIAGGAIRSVLTDEKVNDIDIFFTSVDIANKVKDIIKESLKNGKPFSDRDNMKYLFTKNTLTFLSDETTIQLVHSYAGEPDKIISNFDFTNSMVSYDPRADVIHKNELFETSVERKVLIYNTDCTNKLTALKRCIKFASRGYQISNHDLILVANGAAEAEKTKKDVFANEDCDYGDNMTADVKMLVKYRQEEELEKRMNSVRPRLSGRGGAR